MLESALVVAGAVVLGGILIAVTPVSSESAEFEEADELWQRLRNL